MRAIFYAGLLVAAATFLSCKQDNNEQAPPNPPVIPELPSMEDNLEAVTIFKVAHKDSLPTSPEDAAWITCQDKQEKSSENFMNYYIFNYGGFNASLQITPSWPEDATHLDYINNLPPPMDNDQWAEHKFYPGSFYIRFASTSTEQTVVAYDNIKDTLRCRRFIKIARQNRDTSYNGYYWKTYTKFSRYSYIPTEYVNIECVQNYNASHPAGTLLNDIAVIDYSSAESFIRSGYKNLRMEDNCWFARKGILPEPLNEFNNKQVNMVAGLRFMVSLTQAPDVEGVYSFKLTYKDISGETRTATTIPIRLAAK